MLKDDLVGIIEEWLSYRPREIKDLAQAIIDRLEIDEEKIKQAIYIKGTDPWLDKGDGKKYYFADIEGIIEKIAKAKPIKLKEVINKWKL